MAGSILTVNTPGAIGRDILAGGNAVSLQAPVGRNVTVSGNTLTVGSTIGGAVNANVTDLVLGNGAVVHGPVSYVSGHDATVASGARLPAAMQRTPPSVRAANPWDMGGIDTLALIRGFIGLAALGILLVLAFPRAAATTAATIQYRWAGSLGLGFGLLVGIPVLGALIVLGAIVFGIGAVALSGWRQYRGTPAVDRSAPNGRVVTTVPVAV